MKHAFLLAVLLSPALLSAAYQEQPEETPRPMREIRVKIVYDQFFAENARKLAALWARGAADVITSAPDDAAIVILKRLSQNYENTFGIRLVLVRPMTNAILNPPQNGLALTDIGYANMLLHAPCNTADIMLELTGLRLVPAQHGEHFAPAGDLEASGADTEHGRVFTGLYTDKSQPEEIADTVMRLDHEMRHLFGAEHPLGVAEGTDEADRFVRESTAVVLANRNMPLHCLDFGNLPDQDATSQTPEK